MIMMPAPRVARGLPSPPPETRSSSPLAVHIPFAVAKRKKANASPRRLPCVDAATATQRITSTHTRIPQCASAPGVYAHACAGFSDNLTTVMIITSFSKTQCAPKIRRYAEQSPPGAAGILERISRRGTRGGRVRKERSLPPPLPSECTEGDRRSYDKSG